MEEKKSARKKWVRRVAVIFFVVLLLLTFFSNTIMNYSLPKVATKEVTSESVSAKVRGTGTIEAGEEKAVTINEDRTVQEVKVKEGDSVKKDDVLVTFVPQESEEVKTAMAQVEEAKTAYYKQILVGEIPQEIVNQAENGGVSYDTGRAKLTSLSQNITAAEQKLASAQNAFNNFDETSDVESTEGLELQNAIDTAQKEYDAAVEAHTKYLEEINLIDELRVQYKAIKDAEAELAALQRNSMGNEVKAGFDGIIQSVNVQNGVQVAAAEELMVMVNSSNGFKLSIPVTIKESKKVAVGDKAAIADSWYYGDATAEISDIKNDASNPGKQKIIVFKLTGDLTAGESMTVSVGEKSQKYDYVVPNSAIREDNKGNFVLIIKSKSSPLGNRYYAQKIPVEVLQSDDKNSAVKGAVEEGDYVITTSDKIVNAGDLVRLAD